MRKNHLAITALLALVTMHAGAESNVTSIAAADGVKKQSESIRPDSNGKLILTAEQLSGLQALNERIQAPLTVKQNNPAEIKARLEGEQIHSVAIQNREMLEKQRIHDGIKRARIEQESIAKQATARAAMRGGSSSRYQWDQPYQAFGDGVTLNRVDLSLKMKSSGFQKFGEQLYTYDSKGNVTKSEYTAKNVNGIISKMSYWAIDIPANATVKEIAEYSENTRNQESFYIDPVTGQRHDLSQYKQVSYNGSTVVMISREVDKNGQMIDYGKIESDFDAQGRPVRTIRYSQYSITDSLTGIVSVILKPYRKIEYEYPSNDLTTYTESSYLIDDNGNEIWVYESKYTTNNNSNSGDERYYEGYYYNESTNSWVGNSKYHQIYKMADDKSWSEETYTNWRWNSEKKEWEDYNRYYNKYNSRGYNTFYELYYYSADLNAYYLYSQQGYDYLGDTLRCGEWYVSYYSPSTPEELAQSTQKINYAYKNEYTYYTEQEISWTLSPYQSLPVKTEINYNYDYNNPTTLIWIPNSKTEYQYSLVSYWGSSTPSPTTVDRKQYSWDSVTQDWTETYEYKYGYNEYGDEILEERYVNGTLNYRINHGFKYNVIYSDNDSALNRSTMFEEYWQLRNGEFMPSSRYEYDYDENGNRNLEISWSWWNDNKWNYGYKYEYTYDDNGRQTMYASYNWDATKGVWIGSSKELTEYDSYGDVIRRESFRSEPDGSDSIVWIPNYLEEIRKDEAGRIVLSIDCNYWYPENNSWSYAEKNEWIYSSAGVLTTKLTYNWQQNDWFCYAREEYSYNDAGQLTEFRFKGYHSSVQAFVTEQRRVYTYTESGELKDTYYYYNYWEEDDKEMLSQKQVAIITDGHVTAYIDSVLSYYGWSPRSMTEYYYDETTGRTTTIQSEWDFSDSIWQP